jgi:tetratricopeptide (TPR) repeat protein
MRKGRAETTMTRKIKWTLVGTIAGILIFVLIAGYYYWTTPPSTIAISAGDFPAGVSLGFTSDVLKNRAAAHLGDIVLTADSQKVGNLGKQEGLAPRPITEKTFPVRSLSKLPSPVFALKWKGLSADLGRLMGISSRIKTYLDIEVVGSPQGNGWRLLAFLIKSPQYVAESAGSAPRGGGTCSDMETCIDDLTEQAMRKVDAPRLLNYYINLGTEPANQQILSLYADVKDAQADDLVAWGNAFYGLHRYPEAMEKYQTALEEKPNFCAAHIAAGLVHYFRKHDKPPLPDFKAARDDFAAGVACNDSNALAHANLCAALIRVWANSTDPDANLLTQARAQCDDALAIDSHLVIAGVNSGYIMYRQGKTADALRYLEELSQRYTTDSYLFSMDGFLQDLEYMNGNKDALHRATDMTLQAWNLDPTSFVTADNLGFLYYEQGDVQQAVDFWNKSIVLNGSEPDSLAGLALGLDKLNRETEALASLNAAILQDDHYKDPNYLLAHEDWTPKAVSDLRLLLSKRSPAGVAARN